MDQDENWHGRSGARGMGGRLFGRYRKNREMKRKWKWEGWGRHHPKPDSEFLMSGPKFYYRPADSPTKGLALGWWMSQALICFLPSNDWLEPSSDPWGPPLSGWKSLENKLQWFPWSGEAVGSGLWITAAASQESWPSWETRASGTTENWLKFSPNHS